MVQEAFGGNQLLRKPVLYHAHIGAVAVDFPAVMGRPNGGGVHVPDEIGQFLLHLKFQEAVKIGQRLV